MTDQMDQYDKRHSLISTCNQYTAIKWVIIIIIVNRRLLIFMKTSIS